MEWITKQHTRHLKSDVKTSRKKLTSLPPNEVFSLPRKWNLKSMIHLHKNIFNNETTQTNKEKKSRIIFCVEGASP